MKCLMIFLLLISINNFIYAEQEASAHIPKTPVVDKKNDYIPKNLLSKEVTSQKIINVPKKINGKEQKESNIVVYGDIMEGFPDGVRIVRGNLKAINGDMTLTGDWGKYYESNQIVEAYGKVKIDNPSYYLTCGMVIAYFDEDRGVAKQNPVVIEKVEKSSTTGEIGIVSPVKNKYLRLSAREITSYFNEDRMVANDKVHVEEILFPRFVKPGMNNVVSDMTCDSLEMFMKENKSIGRGNVIMKSGNITAYGEESVYYHDEEKIIITGNAKAVQDTGQKSKKNRVMGEKLVYFVKTGRIVVLKARADVYPGSEQKEKKDANPEN